MIALAAILYAALHSAALILCAIALQKKNPSGPFRNL
jgi:hypothetical protein